MGAGYSSVVTAQGLVYTTGRIAGDVWCFAMHEESGVRQWATRIGETSRNVMATPSVDANFTYALDPDGELICLNAADGSIVWQRSFMEDFGGRLMSGRGYGESPLIDGERLICTPGGAEAMMVALDRRTGDVIWKCSLPELGEKGRDGAAFSSIAILEAAGIRQYVQLAGRGLIGVEAASGRFLWGYNDISNETANIPTPIVRDDMVFAANGYHAGCVLLKIESAENETGVAAREVYRLRGDRFQNHHGGFVLIGDHIFGGHGSNNGLPTCLDFASGKILWKQRGPGTGSASVVAADGHLYFHYQDGVVALIEANAERYRLKGKFLLSSAGGDSWSHPVISGGRLLLREQDDLWAYTLRGDAESMSADAAQSAPAEFTGLSKLGTSVEIIHAGSTDGRLFRYALNDSQDRLPVVTLSEQHIELSGTIRSLVLEQLQLLNTPFALNLAGTPVNADGVRQAARLPQLVGLSLELCPNADDAAFEPLGAADGLRILIATGTAIGRAGLAHLEPLPNLAALDLEVCDNVADDACDVLTRLRALRALNLKKTGFESRRISSQGVHMLSRLQQLELLNLGGAAVTDESLAQLKPLQNLRELDLSLTAVTDAGLTHLTVLQQLRHLKLLYSEGFAGPVVTNAGTPALSQLTELRSLNLVGARITDDGISPLKSLQKLERLVLTGSRISRDGLTQIQNALPHCDIVARR